MSDILCRWLNQKLQLSKTVDPKSIAKDFSSGYLFGEVLHKYQLQSDFCMFLKKDTSVSKLNNFTRLEPTLQLLGISFDVNTAQDLMQEKQGVATHLLYQLYASLEKNRKAEISGTMMEVMQPAGCASLHKKEHQIYSHRLHQVVKRDAELKLQKISQHYEEKFQQSVGTYLIEEKRQVKVQNEKRLRNIDKLQAFHQRHKGMTVNQVANIQVPKPPPYTSQLSLKKRQQQQKRKEWQAQIVQTEIAQFETNRKKVITAGLSSSGQSFPIDFPLGGSSQGSEFTGSGTKVMLQSNSKYIQEIRKRLEENAVACKQREKRQDRFLVEQLKVHEAQEEARREEQLVKRLTRQTQQEQRLAAQLLQIRMEKEVIRENRLFREQQYLQRQERDFQEALDREAALAQQAKLDRSEEIKKELEFCKRTAAERAQRKYKKHFESCKGILEQIVDLATKAGEYRLLTGNLIPEKLMREWKELLFSDLPLYEPIKDHQPGFEFSTPLDSVELQKQEILNNQDYDEYTNMVGEWEFPEEAEEMKLPVTNNILGHIFQRLRNTVDPPISEPSLPLFSHFTLKACVLGKFCSGKTSCLSKIAEAHGICVLSTETLIEEALNAYKNGEKSIEEEREEDNEQQLTNVTSVKSGLENQEGTDGNATLSKRAAQGAAVEKELRKGNAVPNELLVDIIVETISHLPAQSGWILDGFPFDITQAHLLEKALGGAVDVENKVLNSRKRLAKYFNPPKPPHPTAPVLHLALLLDIPDECAVSRGYTQMDMDNAAATSQHADKDVYLAQIAHRIIAFQDTWPKLEKWFGEKQNILVRVDADVDSEELYSRVESIMQQAMLKTQRAVPSPPVEDAVLDSAKAPALSSLSTPSAVDQPAALTEETLDPTESCSSLKEEKDESLRGHSRNASVSSVNSQGVAKNSPKSFCPHSSVQLYVDEPLPPEIPEYLCSYWETVWNSYVNDVKAVMQELRLQRSLINHHLFNIRECYKHYLGRPDLKQELVSQWQKDFNSIPDDMRKDEDIKAELHLRLDELCERLWDIADKRKEEDEHERASLMSNGWLEEHTAVLINHHSTLMQVELNRFQETLCILRIYYLSMCGKMLPKPLSAFVYIPLMENPEIKIQDESSDPLGSSLCNLDDGADKKIFFTPLTRHTHTSGRVSKTKGQDQPEPVIPPHEKLISDHEEALTAISNLVSEEAHMWETKVQKEKLPEKVEEQASTGANIRKKQKQPSTNEQSTPQQTPILETAEEKTSENVHDHKVREKIHKEYSAALNYEENAVKVCIALVKAHGLVMVQSLQSRAEEISANMEKWQQDRYLAEMKSIDQLTEVVHHHIAAGTKLQNELVLECSGFYLNGDCHMVASPVPPPRPPPFEKPVRSTPTVVQLESLYQQLYNICPSGFMSTSEFFSLLKDIITIKTGKDSLPEPWMDRNESQLMEIVSLLTDGCELVDWRRFLLSAALPWPFPLLTQLLDVLQRFKAADPGDTGYINEEQYLKTELWFATESVQTVPEDPSEPVPYDRLANLHKFFFQLFADHSFSPSRMDYVSMLRYFAADPNPTQGFIRALSVVLGQQLKHSSLGYLVKSMPTMEENTDLTSSELDGDYKEETLRASSFFREEQEVSIPALLSVICHKITKVKDKSHLLSCGPSQEEQTENLVRVFRELGYDPEDHVPFSILSQHPSIQLLMETCTHHKLVDIHRVLQDNQNEGGANSLTLL